MDKLIIVTVTVVVAFITFLFFSEKNLFPKERSPLEVRLFKAEGLFKALNLTRTSNDIRAGRENDLARYNSLFRRKFRRFVDENFNSKIEPDYKSISFIIPDSSPPNKKSFATSFQIPSPAKYFNKLPGFDPGEQKYTFSLGNWFLSKEKNNSEIIVKKTLSLVVHGVPEMYCNAINDLNWGKASVSLGFSPSLISYPDETPIKEAAVFPYKICITGHDDTRFYITPLLTLEEMYIGNFISRGSEK